MQWYLKLKLPFENPRKISTHFLHFFTLKCQFSNMPVAVVRQQPEVNQDLKVNTAVLIFMLSAAQSVTLPIPYVKMINKPPLYWRCHSACQYGLQYNSGVVHKRVWKTQSHVIPKAALLTALKLDFFISRNPSHVLVARICYFVG